MPVSGRTGGGAVAAPRHRAIVGAAPRPARSAMPEPQPSPVPARRAISVRAVAIGLVLALALAWIAPWNDWFLRNAYLYNNFLPPIVTMLLLLVAVVVNPLLGARRLVRGELAVITGLVLAAGGLSSIGFARYWTISVTAPARILARQPNEALKVPLAAAARAGPRLARRGDARRLRPPGCRRRRSARARRGLGRRGAGGARRPRWRRAPVAR